MVALVVIPDNDLNAGMSLIQGGLYQVLDQGTPNNFEFYFKLFYHFLLNEFLHANDFRTTCCIY